MSGFTRNVGDFVEIIEPLDGEWSEDEFIPATVDDDTAFPTINEIIQASKYLPPIPRDAPRLLHLPAQHNVVTGLTQQTLQREELALGNWPRRLLHVPSMTSYEWEPGNIYGTHPEPVYNCITYTWGRYRLPSDDASTEALPVKNVSWKVPKVDPAHFQVSDFRNALATTVSPFAKPGASWERYKPVEFIWLDVACICQEDGDPRSAAEIGRQAKIFRNAQAVFIWLTTFDGASLKSLMSTLHRDVASGSLDEPRKLSPDTAQCAFTAMETILEDPWFSSLWTLQEAFLRHDALFMTGDGHVVELERYFLNSKRDATRYRTAVDLIEFLEFAADLRRLPRICCPNSSSADTVLSMKDLHAKVVTLAQSRGLLALYTTSPLSTFTVASSRVTSEASDRIYAIQQIFDFRLGSSSIDSKSAILPSPDGRYNLEQLQDQLGEHLMLTYPIHSQTHVYTTEAAVGKAWRVNDTSVVPGAEEGEGMFWEDSSHVYPQGPSAWPDDGEESRKLCRLDVAFVEGNVWGQFEARLCSFVGFHRKVQEYEADCIMTRAYEAGSNSTFLQIWPDITAELRPSPDYAGPGYHPIPRSRQRAFAEWLADSFDKDELMVMILGTEFPLANKDGTGRGGDTLGLLVVKKRHRETEYWHRIGLCRWMSSELTFLGIAHVMRIFFQGLTEEWVLSKGLLG